MPQKVDKILSWVFQVNLSGARTPKKLGKGCVARFPKPYPIYDDFPYPIRDLT